MTQVQNPRRFVGIVFSQLYVALPSPWLWSSRKSQTKRKYFCNETMSTGYKEKHKVKGLTKSQLGFTTAHFSPHSSSKTSQGWKLPACTFQEISKGEGLAFLGHSHYKSLSRSQAKATGGSFRCFYGLNHDAGQQPLASAGLILLC